MKEETQKNRWFLSLNFGDIMWKPRIPHYKNPWTSWKSLSLRTENPVDTLNSAMTEKSSWWILSHSQEREFFIKGEIPWKSSERTGFFSWCPFSFVIYKMHQTSSLTNTNLSSAIKNNNNNKNNFSGFCEKKGRRTPNISLISYFRPSLYREIDSV